MLYRITVCRDVSASHQLKLDYESKCKNLHGHNYGIQVEISAPKLNDNGMVCDFSLVKKVIDRLDHCNLNDLEPFKSGENPTAENICKYIKVNVDDFVQNSEKQGNALAQVTHVWVAETKGNVAELDWDYLGAK